MKLSKKKRHPILLPKSISYVILISLLNTLSFLLFFKFPQR